MAPQAGLDTFDDRVRSSSATTPKAVTAILPELARFGLS
jgi:hypothetical protein